MTMTANTKPASNPTAAELVALAERGSARPSGGDVVVTLTPYTACRYAAMLGSTRVELELLHAGDPRIIAPPALETEGSVWRLRRWIQAGRPEADLRRLAFVGSYSVRKILLGVLRELPTPAAHYAVEAIIWRAVGRGATGWITRALLPRALPGDGGHEVNLDAGQPDEVIRSTVAHEAGHGIHLPITTEPTPAELHAYPEEDCLAARVLRAKNDGADADALAYERAVWIGARVTSELRADRQSAAWGIPHHGPDADALRRHFAAKYDEAVRLAALAEQLDDDGGAPPPGATAASRAASR